MKFDKNVGKFMKFDKNDGIDHKISLQTMEYQSIQLATLPPFPKCAKSHFHAELFSSYRDKCEGWCGLLV